MKNSAYEGWLQLALKNRKTAITATLASVSIAALSVGALMLANPASAVPAANSICHSTGNGTYRLIPPNGSGIAHGHAQDPDDIIPNVRNWESPGQAIWLNDCVVPSASSSASSSASPTETSDNGGNALVDLCSVSSGPGQVSQVVKIANLISKPSYSVNPIYANAIFAALSPEYYTWLDDTTIPAQGDQTILANECSEPTPSPTPTVTVTAPGTNTNTTTTVNVPGPTVTVTATPSVSPSAVAPVAVAPVAVAPVASPSKVPPVAVAPVSAAVPTAVNAGDGSSQQRPMSPVGIGLMALAGVGVLFAAFKLTPRRRPTSSQQ